MVRDTLSSLPGARRQEALEHFERAIERAKRDSAIEALSLAGIPSEQVITILAEMGFRDVHSGASMRRLIHRLHHPPKKS